MNKTGLLQQEVVYGATKNSAIRIAYKIIDEFLPGEIIEAPLDKIEEIIQRVKQNQFKIYQPIVERLQKDIEKEKQGKSTEFFILPELVLFILEKLQQENLQLLLCSILLKIEKETHIIPKEKIQALKTGLCQEKTQEIFEHYIDPVTTDYIRKPIRVRGRIYDTLTYIKLLVKNIGMHANLDGTQESYDALRKKKTVLDQLGIDGSYFLFTAPSEQTAAEILITNCIIKNIQERAHTPEKWEDFIKKIDRNNGLTIKILSKKLTHLPFDARERFIRDQSRLEDIRRYIIEMDSSKEIYWNGSLSTLKGLLEDRKTHIKPEILQDLKYIGCTLQDPYSRHIIETSDIEIVSKKYWNNLEKLIVQVSLANNMAKEFKQAEEKNTRQASKYFKIHILKDFYRSFATIMREMSEACESKRDANSFISGLPSKFDDIFSSLQQPTLIKNIGDHITQGKNQQEKLLINLKYLTQKAPQLLSDFSNPAKEAVSRIRFFSENKKEAQSADEPKNKHPSR